LCLNPNKIRVINTKLVVYKQGTKISKTIFGFMGLGGKDVVMVSDKAKASDMIKFIELIRKENPSQDIYVFLDNAQIHKAKSVVQKAEQENIKFIYLPPYSPDLNPIEFGWKDLKRELAKFVDFDIMVEKSEEKALELFKERKFSYAKNWTKNFLLYS
jgi:putative transposase